MKNRLFVPWTLAAVLALFLALNTGCVRPRPARDLAAAPPAVAELETQPPEGGSSYEEAPLPRLENQPAGPTRLDTLDAVAADEGRTDAGGSGARESIADGELTNQELLDSAMEFYQASSDFWEQGDLDNATGALDKAYSLILQVKPDADPELLQQKEDLRITISRRIVEVYSSRFTVANGNHMAIPLVMNDEVEKALDTSSSMAALANSVDLYLLGSSRLRRAITPPP